MKKITIRIVIILSVICFFWACTKELSIENGGFTGSATGELVDSLGNCKNITIRGSYVVDTALTNNNFILVNINFTATGKYNISSDTVNGMWFVDSGFAISLGPTEIKVNGKGTPILEKPASFKLLFGNTECSFTINTSGSGGSGGGGGGGGGSTGSNGDYFPTTSGSTWTYQYIPTLGNVDTFNVTVAVQQVVVPNDTLVYSKFGTSLVDTFYFSKDGKGNYYTYSTVDFDYTFLFDSIPNAFIGYPFLKENAIINETWETIEYGKVRYGTGSTAQRGVAKAKFTLISKNTVPYTIGGKVYQNVINIQREILFKADGSSTFALLIKGNSYYAKDFGLIDQVIGTPVQNVSLFRTPTIK